MTRTELCPYLFGLFFCLLYFSYLLLKTMGCFSGCLMSSAGIQKLFCGIYSAFKCSFDEFVGEKVFSPSYSFAILAPPPGRFFTIATREAQHIWLAIYIYKHILLIIYSRLIKTSFTLYNCHVVVAVLVRTFKIYFYSIFQV